MRNINLGFFEKIYINLRCRKDWKNKRFCDFYTGLSLSRSRFSRSRTNGELATEATDIHYSDDYDKDSKESTILVVSPFVTAELGQFIAKRDNILAKKLCVIKYSKDNTIRHRILKFPDAIAFLDDQIRIVEGDIACLEAEYQATISSFQEKYDYNIVHGDIRLATASIKGAHVRRDKYRAAKKLKYDALFMLLSEKIRIINVVNARINVFKTWRFSRIRYYYSLACTWTMRLPVSVYSDTDFNVIAKQNFDQEYTGELESSKVKFDQLKKDIEFPNEDTILEKSPEEIMDLRSIAIMKENNEAHLNAASATKGVDMGFENASSDIEAVCVETEESVPNSTEVVENIDSEKSSATVTSNLCEEVEVTEDLNPENLEDKATEKISDDKEVEPSEEVVSDSASTGVIDSEVPSNIINEDESEGMTVSDPTSRINAEAIDSEVVSTIITDNNIEDSKDDDSSRIERVKILESDVSSVTEDAEVNVEAARSDSFKENLNSEEPSLTVADIVPDEINRRDSAISESAEDMDFDEIFNDVSDKETTEGEIGKTKNSESFDADMLSSTNIYNVEEKSEERTSDETVIATDFVDREAVISDFTSTEAVDDMSFDEIFDAIADIAEGEIYQPEVDNIDTVEFADAAEDQEDADFVASTTAVADDASEEMSESVSEDTDPEEEKLFDELFTESAADAEEVESSDVPDEEVPEEAESNELSTTVADDIAEEMSESVSEDTDPEEEKLFDELFTEIAADAEEVESSDVPDEEVPEEAESNELSTTVADDIAEEMSESVSEDTDPEEEKLFDELFTEIAADAEEVESSDVPDEEVPEEADSDELSTTVADDVAEEMSESVSEDTEPEEEKLFDELFTEIAADAEEVESSDVPDEEVPEEAESNELSTTVADDVAEEMSESVSEDTDPEEEKLFDELFTESAANAEEVESSDVPDAEVPEAADSGEFSITAADDVAEEMSESVSEDTEPEEEKLFDELFTESAASADEAESSDVTGVEVPEETDSVSSTAAVAGDDTEEVSESVSEDTEPEEEKLFDELFTGSAASADDVVASDVTGIEVPEETDSDESTPAAADDTAEEMSESVSEDTEPEEEKLFYELFTESAARVEEVETTEVYGVKVKENLDSNESSAVPIDKTAEKAKVIEDENAGIADDMDFDEIFSAIAGVADIDTE